MDKPVIKMGAWQKDLVTGDKKCLVYHNYISEDSVDLRESIPVLSMSGYRDCGSLIQLTKNLQGPGITLEVWALLKPTWFTKIKLKLKRLS